MAKTNFTSLVREIVHEILPAYHLVETVAGSAPHLLFRRPGSKDRPLFQELVWFSKLRWGIPELDVGLDLKYLGPTVGGVTRAYGAAPLGAEPTRGLPVDDNVAATLRRELPTIDRHASDVFSRYYTLYPRMHALGDELAQLYVAWRNRMPAELADTRAMLASAPELQGVDTETATLRRHKLFPFPSRALQERRVDHFRQSLVENGRLTSLDDPTGYWLTDFWYHGRPRTADEFKAENVGDECARCHEIRTRGRVREKVDAAFGSHAEFVCSMCEPK